jgi:hypothetical protein
MIGDQRRDLSHATVHHPAYLSHVTCHLSLLSRWFGGLLVRGLALNWHFFFWSDFVFRFRHAHQPMIEPAHNVLQSLDPMPWLTGARELVGFVWEPHHHRRNLSKL